MIVCIIITIGGNQRVIIVSISALIPYVWSFTTDVVYFGFSFQSIAFLKLIDESICLFVHGFFITEN